MDFSYLVIKQARKTISLSVTPKMEVLLKVPLKLYGFDLEGFVNSKRGWILKQLIKQQNLHKISRTRSFAPGDMFLYLGRQYPLAYSNSLIGVQGDFIYCPNVTKPAKIAALKSWYKSRTTELISKILAERKVGKYFSFQCFKVTSASRQWGACTKQGKLFFSWRLSMVPMEVLWYVVAHELSHLKEHNHQARFWREVSRLDPDFKSHRAYLKNNYLKMRF